MRPSGRNCDELRHAHITRQFTCHGEGSVLIELGNTKVICTASVEEGVPRFLKGKKQGWVTAEYAMLPRATGVRTQREAVRGKQSGRTLEISRLIGRSLRAAVDLQQLAEYSITLDCDVIQADGGTRTAAITGAFYALSDAIEWMLSEGMLSANPITAPVAAVSVGLYQGQAILDLDYAEDSQAQTDLNVVMTAAGGFVEIQGTAEQQAFSRTELNAMLDLAESGIQQLLALG